MRPSASYQIVISGVGGQGVLFITRLLAEAAIQKGLPVFTSETHGMAQRGGTVISHLKIGDFASPLIRPGRADGLIALKAEGLRQHGGYLKPGGWAVVNDTRPPSTAAGIRATAVDADRLAGTLHNPKALNLIVLGFTLAQQDRMDTALHCRVDEMADILKKRLARRPRLRDASLEALKAGADGAGSG